MKIGEYVTEEQALEADALIYRQSTGESMGLCPARVALSTEPGFKQGSSEPMSFGTLVHFMIETFLVSEENERGRLQVQLASTEWIREQWAILCEKDGYILDEVCPRIRQDKSAEEAARAFSLWLDWWDAAGHNLDIQGVEVEKLRVIGHLDDGRPIVLKGTADLVLTGGCWDWKTAGREWEEGKALTRQQSPLYVYLNEDVIGVRDVTPFTYMIFDRKAGRWQWITVEVTPAQVEAALLIAVQRARQIDAGAMPGTPATDSYGKLRRGWYCKPQYCGAWEICPYKGAIADGFDLTQTIPTVWA